MQLPFGLWSSPVDSKIYAHPPLGLQEMQASGDYVYWTEVRPLEKGRHALMRASFDESPIELFPSMNIRTAVHEYG